jgi:serine/threonine protein kinase
MPDPQTPPPGSTDGIVLPETEVDSRAPAQPDSQAVPAHASAAPTPRQSHAASTPRQHEGPPPPSHDWLIGKTVDHYIIEEKIGEGAFGAVYRARDIRNVNPPRQVVIKFLKKVGPDNDWVVGKFKQEAEALVLLDNHPGIVGLLDAGEFNGLPYIILQYVNGTPLRKHIRPGGMRLEEISEIVKQTASALAEVHSLEILHRDLKPENIMLRKLASPEPKVTVIDFGIAKVKNSYLSLSSETGQVAGTALYMSPEQLRGDNKTLTPASEVYSLAVIVYEMLTGILPFNAHDINSLRQRQEDGLRVKPRDLRPELPPRAQDILLRALAFKRADRYQNIKTFGDELALALLTPVPPPRLKKRHAVLLIAALVLALAATIWVVVRRLPTRDSSPTNAPARQPAVLGNPAATIAPAPKALTYWLTVQKMSDGKALGAPEEFSGTESFSTGWKFKINVTPAEDGYFYLLNASPQPNGGTEWNVLFPTPKNNAGQSKLEGQRRQTFGWYVFDDKTGQEKFWIVWSRQPVPDMESAVKAATKTKLVIKEPELTAVTNFLQPWEGQPPNAIANELQKRTVIESEQPTWACFINLRHDKR